jgi:hypothetical protein
MHDMFWKPAKGDLVLIKPGTHAAWFKSAADLLIPRRCLEDVTHVEGHPMVWAVAIGPIRRRTLANGRVIEEGPNNQQPFMVEELMPYEAPAEAENGDKSAPKLCAMNMTDEAREAAWNRLQEHRRKRAAALKAAPEAAMAA